MTMIQANKLIVIAEMIIFLLLYLGLAINLNTAEGIPNWPNVIHNETVGITKKYKAIASSLNCLAKIIRLRILNSLAIAELAERMMKELISFLFIKHFLSDENCHIICK